MKDILLIIWRKRMVKINLLLIFILNFQNAFATHPLPIVNLQSTNNGSEIVISGESDAATCSSTGNDWYYLQVELICTMSDFSGNPNYQSTGLNKTVCTQVPYNPVIIPFSSLCPGTTYKWRVRELLTGATANSGNGGTWSQVYYFTTPGTPPPPPIVTANSVESTLLCGNSTTIYAQNTGGCGTVTFSWVEHLTGGGTISLGRGKLKAVTPNQTTTYSVTGRDTCTGFTDTKSVTITVAPTTATSNFTACPGENITFQPSVPNQFVDKGQQFVFSNSVKTPIKDLQTNYSNITVSGLGAVSSRNYTVGSVRVNIVHGNDADLIISLRSPSGDVILLSSRNGGMGDNYTNTVFSDGAVNSITTGTAPFTANFKPQGTGGLASMIGSAVNGTWSLEVHDITGNRIEGYVDSWSLTLFDDTFLPITNYSWNTTKFMTDQSLSSPKIITDTTISYVLTVRYLNCTYTHTFNVNVHPKVLKVSPAPPVCDGQPAQLNATGGISYLWSPAATLSNPTIANPIASPTSTTKYYVSMEDNIGCKKVDSVIVKVGSLPPASAGSNTTVCFGSQVQLDASGGDKYIWEDPNSFLNNVNIRNPFASPTSNTTFKVTVIDTSTGCSKDAFVNVEVIPAPVFSIPNAIICKGDSVMLQATEAPNYKWSPAIGLSDSTIANPFAFPQTTQTYQVTATSSTCPYTTTVTVTVNEIPIVDAGNDKDLCENGTVQLNATGANSYIWTPSEGLSNPTSNSPSVNATFSRSYTVTGTTNGCSASDVIIITVRPVPDVNAGPDLIVCPGSPTQLSAVGYDSEGITSYVWTPAATLSDPSLSKPIASPTVTTDYTVTVSNAYGCTATDVVKVEVKGAPLSVTSSNTPASCWGESTGKLQLNVSGGTGGTYNYNWFPGVSTTSSANNLPAGLYVITITDNASGCQHQEAIVINQPPRMTAEYSIQNSTCKSNNGVIGVENIINGTAPFTYAFNSQAPSTSNFASLLAEGANVVTITDDKGCIVQDTLVIENSGEPVIASFINSAHTGAFPAEISFTNTTTGASAYHWAFENGQTSQSENPSVSFENYGNYNVTLIASNNFCSDTLSYLLLLEEPLDFIIPNVFTPNGDGKNDLFTISGKGMAYFKGEIFNRWGKKVYEWSDQSIGWDGKGMDEGVYFFIVTFISFQDQHYKYTGHVTLNR